MQKEYNFPHITLTCNECGCQDIRMDPFHQETYCTHCGIILQDNTLFQITRILDKEQQRNLNVNRFWKDTHKEIRLKHMRDIWKK